MFDCVVSDTVLAETTRRLATYYTTLSEEKTDYNVEGYRHLDLEHAQIIHILEACQKHELWEPVIELVGAIDTYLDLQGHWIKRKTVLRINLAAARQAGDRKNESWCLSGLGRNYRICSDDTTALHYYEQALALDRELGDRKDESVSLNSISLIYKGQGDFAMALDYLEQSLLIKREIGDKKGEGAILNNISQVHQAQGDYTKALRYLKQTLVIARKTNKRGEGITLNNIGRVYREQGDNITALRYYEQDLAITREIGDKRGESITCWNIGRAYEDQGNLSKAEQYLDCSFGIMEEIGSPDLEKHRQRLERVRAQLGQQQSARDDFCGTHS